MKIINYKFLLVVHLNHHHQPLVQRDVPAAVLLGAEPHRAALVAGEAPLDEEPVHGHGGAHAVQGLALDQPAGGAEAEDIDR